MASAAVSLCWWSYRSSLSSRSRASGLTRCWFSDWMNCSQRFRVCLKSWGGEGGLVSEDQRSRSSFQVYVFNVFIHLWRFAGFTPS